MAVAFRRQLHNAEVLFESQVSPCEFRDGQCGSGTCFSPNTRFLFVDIIPPVPDTYLLLEELACFLFMFF